MSNKAAANHTHSAKDVGAAERNVLEISRFGTSSTAYTGWIEVGRFPLSTTYGPNRTTIFLVLGSQKNQDGILSLFTREEPLGTIHSTISKLEWLSVRDERMVDKFALASEDGYGILYAKVSGTFDYFHMGIIAQTYDTNYFLDPTDSRAFKLTSNYGLEGNYKESITPVLISAQNAILENKVDAVAPMQLDLPMSSGFGGISKYSKTQDGIVIINLYAELSDGESCTDSTVIATLPAGYRPTGERAFAVTTQDSSGRDAAAVRIPASGNVIYQGKTLTQSPVRIFGALVFVAADG